MYRDTPFPQVDIVPAETETEEAISYPYTTNKVKEDVPVWMETKEYRMKKVNATGAVTISATKRKLSQLLD